MSAEQFTFGEYSFNLSSIAAEIEDPALKAWAERAVTDARFLSVLRAQAEPLLDEETADDPLDVFGEGAATVLKASLAALYERRAELPLALSSLQDPLPAVEPLGPRSRPSGLAGAGPTLN